MSTISIAELRADSEHTTGNLKCIIPVYRRRAVWRKTMQGTCALSNLAKEPRLAIYKQPNAFNMWIHLWERLEDYVTEDVRTDSDQAFVFG